MLKMIESIKAQAERDLLYAEAKIDVCNALIAEAKSTANCNCADETAPETDNANIFDEKPIEYSAMPTANL